jgi:cell division protein FtsL
VLDAPVLDRLTRGRAWIALIAAGLIGIVFMQVSLLRLNTGIGRSIQKAQALERQNAQLRDTVAQLASGDRIQTAAQRSGMMMPAADAFHYLDAGRRGDLRRLLRIIEPPASPVPDAVTGQTPGAATPAVTEPQTAATTPPAPDTPATGAASPGAGAATPAPADPVTSTAPGAPSAAPAAPDDPVASAPPAGTTTPGQ